MRIIILTLQLTLKLFTNFFLFVQFVFEPFPLKYCVNHKCYNYRLSELQTCCISFDVFSLFRIWKIELSFVFINCRKN